MALMSFFCCPKWTIKEAFLAMAETGHARNVANFGTLIAFCVGYGGD